MRSLRWLVASATLLGACQGSPVVEFSPDATIPGPTATAPSPEPTAADPTAPPDGTGEPPPPDAPAPARHSRDPGFVVIGDFGSGDPEEFAVAERMRAWIADRRVDAFVTTGDNIYEDGRPSEFERGWERPFGWVDDAAIPVVASLGNHDVRFREGRPVMTLFAMPGRWYARRVGPVDLIVLDSNDAEDPEQLAFLHEALAAAEGRWQVAVFHHPAWSCGPHLFSEGRDIRREWLGRFERLGVDLVLQGHDHNYQRFPAIEGITYVVTGGGGSDLYPLPACPPKVPGTPVATDDDHHHFLYLSAGPGALEVIAVAVPGGTIDRFVIPAG